MRASNASDRRALLEAGEDHIWDCRMVGKKALEAFLTKTSISRDPSPAKRQLGYRRMKYITKMHVTDRVDNIRDGAGSEFLLRWLRLIRRHLIPFSSASLDACLSFIRHVAWSVKR